MHLSALDVSVSPLARAGLVVAIPEPALLHAARAPIPNPPLDRRPLFHAHPCPNGRAKAQLLNRSHRACIIAVAFDAGSNLKPHL